MRKRKRPGKGRKKKIVKEERPMRKEELARRKIVSWLKNRLSKKRKPVLPQPERNKTPLLKSLHAKKKSVNKRSCVIQKSALSVSDSSVRRWRKKELNLRGKRRQPRLNSCPRRMKCRGQDSLRRQRISRDRRSSEGNVRPWMKKGDVRLLRMPLRQTRKSSVRKS